MSLFDDVTKRTGEYLKAAYKGEKINGSKKAVNAIVNNTFGGPEVVGRMLRGEGIQQSFIKTFGKDPVKKSVVQKLEDGTEKTVEKYVANGFNGAKIAGSYLGVAAAGRIVSGGGIYKDRNGNSNLIGVPFV